MKHFRFEQLESRQLLHGGSLEYALDQQFEFLPPDSYYNWGGIQEKWMQTASAGWHFITPDGALRKWEANGALHDDQLIAQLDSHVWETPSLLYDAQPPVDPPPPPPPPPDDPNPHPDNPVKHDEHLAVLALVPVAEATHTAVANGLWSDPATWGGSVPTASSKVWIPAGKTVTVDMGVADWIRVNGKLTFAQTTDSTLVVDTIVVTPGGEFENHSQANSRVIFSDSGPIDTVRDPFALSRGLIAHGITDIDGVDKKDWTTFEPTTSGAAQITVADATGWRVGDRLVIGDAEVVFHSYQYKLANRDEERTIAAIAGNAITLSSPLAYNHAAVEWQNPAVGNLSRNIVFASANTATDRRGHVMLMHSDTHSVKDAAFEGLGRTDKLRPVSDPDGQGNGLSNPRGRYALHFHRTGPDRMANIVSGVAIVGSPGWGLTNHDSNVLADSNVSYNVVGAHFVTELGNEEGAFSSNLAIRSNGTGQPIGNPANDDNAHHGSGFWLEGGDVDVVGNVAIGHSGPAFMFFSPGQRFTGSAHDPPFFMTDNVALHGRSSLFIWASRFAAASVEQYSVVEGNLLQGGVGLGYPQFIDFIGNTIVANDRNFDYFGVQHTGANGFMRYIDNTIKGFHTGLETPQHGVNLVSGGYYDNYNTNILVHNTFRTMDRTIEIINPQFGDRAIWDVQMRIDFFEYNLVGAYGEPYYYAPDWRPLFDYRSGLHGTVTLDGVDLFFEEQGRDFQFGERLFKFPDEIRYNPDGTLATGESLNARGLIVGGEPLPAGVQYHLPKVRGVLVGA